LWGSNYPQDPGGPNPLSKQGEIVFDWGMLWFKGQHVATGQCNVKAYNRQLRELIHLDKAKPSWIVSHTLPLDKAADGYQHFDKREKGWTKVVLQPAA
jgi:glutathione-independent formaldehyde dehydrogenase